MSNKYELLFNAVENCKDTILEAERYIWEHPEVGYREWNTHRYMKEHFEALGYEVIEAGDIPGFYADIDTGREGPCIGIFAEMDALLIPDHPECDKETGAVHACAHHCQCAAMIGLATALKANGALDGLSGKIRLFVVPAEEGIELSYRLDLIKKGILHFIGGKQEFMRRGFLDDVDIGMMVHTGSTGLFCEVGGNGFVCKKHTFIGKASHGAAPSGGLNALYAATNALSATNAVREQFSGDNKFRFHPIITKGGEAVNVIPAEVVVESFVRGGNMPQILKANERINRAFAGSAAALGCKLIIEDQIGAAPRIEDKNLRLAFKEVGKMLFSEDEINVERPWTPGCTDMGDISSVMPSVVAYVGCSSIPGHTNRFVVEDKYTSCVTNAKLQAAWVNYLLCDGAAYAKKVIAEADVPYASIKDYLADAEKLSFSGEAVTYTEDGEITIKYKK
ncbi:MAG: amidohydrolase [Clostridia bacterium]|nr:amidohydrolase [Clostridia bacterium]